MRPITVGFVILTWNSERCISDCLASIFSMREIRAHVFVADNGSTDQTCAMLAQCLPGPPHTLEIIRLARNLGTTAPRNMAIKRLLARNLPYICVADSDTVLNENALLSLIECLNAHPDCGLAGPFMANARGDAQLSARNFPTLLSKLCGILPWAVFQNSARRHDKPAPVSFPHPVEYLISACWMVRRETFMAAGLLDERLFYAPEDVEFCLRALRYGLRAYYCPGALIVHQWQRLSRKKLFSRHNFEHVKGLLYLFRKYHLWFSTEKAKGELPS